MSHAKREVGAACAPLLFLGAEPVTIALGLNLLHEVVIRFRENTLGRLAPGSVTLNFPSRPLRSDKRIQLSGSAAECR